MSQIADILLQITARRRESVERARAGQKAYAVRGGRTTVRQAALQTAGNNRFLAALAAHRGRAIIAEVKMGSPRLGSLVGTFEPLQQARLYAANGAAALSVVVEPDFFHGSYELLAACHEASGLPAVAKDFIVDPIQLQWAQRAGASAILLIAALYEREELLSYARQARQLGLVPLVEVHELGDLSKLEGEVWELVGVNNRDLRTFEVEIGTSMALLPSLPAEAFKVSESGLAGAAELDLLRGVGFDAFLIGESLVTSEDPAAKLREALGAMKKSPHPQPLSQPSTHPSRERGAGEEPSRSSARPGSSSPLSPEGWVEGRERGARGVRGLAPRVKICGLTSPEQALLAVELGADLVGLNFHPPSPRWVEPSLAAEIAAAVRGRATVVGVFVNLPAAEVAAIDQRVDLDLLQFHGDETPGEVAPFAARAIRALRVEGELEAGAVEGWEAVWGWLFDARHPSLYGGSGQSWSYASVNTALGIAKRSKPVLLAGGLGPDNVRSALAARPWGVDVCSGVESAPGIKDRTLLTRFFKEIHDGTSPSST